MASRAWLEERCQYWQDVLGLRDWEVRVLFKDAEFLEEGFGRSHPSMHMKQACIYILDPADVSSSDTILEGEYDVKRTLVHELLHLPMESFSPGESDALKHTLFEQAIEVLARSFVRLERRR